MNRKKRILICPKCEKIWDNGQMIASHVHDGIYFECNNCNDETKLVDGLIVIGYEFVTECEETLDDEFEQDEYIVTG